MIEICVDIQAPRMELRLPAESESLAVVRQALRSLGETVRADRDALDDAELAVTEACANVVQHAYAGDSGLMQVIFEPGHTDMAVTVSDEGLGMGDGEDDGGFGLAMIEGIASRLAVRPANGTGTEVAMYLEMGGAPLSVNGNSPPGGASLERITRRIVAVVAAQADMPTDRLVESLLAVELAARYVPAYLNGDCVQLTFERIPGGFDMRLGPLVADGAHDLVHESELPVIGAVIERLSDQVEFERTEEDGAAPDGERLRLRIDSGSA